MKHLLGIIWVLIVIPLQLFAVSNLKINGETTHTITTLPTQIQVTCDLAQSGNQIEFEIYIDLNGSGEIDAEDMMLEYNIITDGIGWIRDPEQPDEDIPGDETGVDGKLQVSFPFTADERLIQEGQFIALAKEDDGSKASAILMFNLVPVPPYITGKVTDKNTGLPITGIIVMGASDNEDVYDSGIGITDENGDYLLTVDPGTWKIFGYDLLQNVYEPSDSISVTLTASETKTQNIEMIPYTSFVTGTIKMEDGTAVPGIQVWAGSVEGLDFSFAFSDNSGTYKAGVKPGRVMVSAPSLINVALPQNTWPEGYYLDPETDTLDVNQGETVTSNFTFRAYTSFIEGDCKVGLLPLAGVEISAIVVNLQTGTFAYTSTLSDLRGHYKIGVFSGTVTMLTALKDGFDMTSPMFGYTNISVGEGETVSGKDFGFTENSEGMSIAGQVTYSDGSVVPDVYVVAISSFESGPEGFLISSTNSSGQYEFNNLFDDYWKVGVYHSDFVSTPAIFYTEMYSGMKITEADFILGPSTSVGIPQSAAPPLNFYLAQNYPNPFKPGGNFLSTNINFSLRKSEPVEIRVYNIQGQLITMLQDGVLPQGEHHVSWDGRNATGQIVPSGVYFYQIRTSGKMLTKSMLIVR